MSSSRPRIRLKGAVSLISVLALGLAASGCGRVPALKPYYPYLGHPRFSFEYPRLWKAQSIPGGVSLLEPKGRAEISIAYHSQGTPEYKPPELYRQYMAAWGAVEDSHQVSEVSVSSHTAFMARFTSYQYDPEYLLGEKVKVLLVEVLMVPEPEGMYVVRYQARKDDFWKKSWRGCYEHFLGSLILAWPKPRKG